MKNGILLSTQFSRKHLILELVAVFIKVYSVASPCIIVFITKYENLNQSQLLPLEDVRYQQICASKPLKQPAVAIHLQL